VKQPPSIELNDIEPFADYYFDGNDRYSVARLIAEAKKEPVFDLPLAGIDLSYRIWMDSNMYTQAFHVKKVIEADLQYPIILDWNGAVADGRHRILKAIVENKRTIKAVRLRSKLVPDNKE